LKTLLRLDQLREKEFEGEIDALIKLDHPFIVPFVGLILPVGRIDDSASVGSRIASQFMVRGSLRDVLASDSSWWNGTAKSIVIVGVVVGMIFMHELGTIHRDLKPGNILLDECHRPRICDFGSSRDLSLSATMTSKIGTPLYMAPELYNDTEDYDNKIDVYSFSLILFEIVTGRSVFSPTLNPIQLAREHEKCEHFDVPKDVEASSSLRICRSGTDKAKKSAERKS
jgi:serine/threonine protein kinase